MFEKDIKEEAEKRCSKYFQENCYKENRWANTHDLVAMYLDGYNKSNEWHKPSEKLPEECSLVLAYLFEETEPTICEYVVSNQWECLPKRIVFCSNDQIRLWKEIVPPKELDK